MLCELKNNSNKYVNTIAYITSYVAFQTIFFSRITEMLYNTKLCQPITFFFFESKIRNTQGI